jgi:hypothetical protein
MCLSFVSYDAERLEQLCHFTLRSVLVTTWFTLPSLSKALSPILSITLFLLANIFGGGSL